MIKQYIQQAMLHLRENPVITWVSLLGTALSICMIMVVVITIRVRTADCVPEVNRSRSAFLESVSYLYNEKGTRHAMCGPRLAAELAQNLKTPEAVAIYTSPYFNLAANDFYLRAQAHENVPKVNLKACNSDFWEVFRFR